MDTARLEVEGGTIDAAYHPAQVRNDQLPLVVALHGGTYTSAYFDVAGGPLGSFLDIAARVGFDVLTIDRPGYGGSDLLPEEDNTFARQAELLDAAIAQYLDSTTARDVVLVGHSIGGMIALEIAARRPAWTLVGVSATGMGAVIPSGGAAEQLGALPLSGVIDLPVADRDGVMLGPPGSFTEQAREAAHGSYAPTPFVELVLAPRWATERLRSVAAQVSVPVHNVLAEHDALWDSSDAARADFAAMFSGPVSSSRAPGVGHSLDHHVTGATLHLEQLAFAYSCTVGVSASSS